ncbi:uncharacterized protein [Dendropsophus ebraccatus]|uniref:uncharacterized protein n=1 Tax=Dendropsophus ebraccatus TaxID=150705 RepID=UPI0038311AE6
MEPQRIADMEDATIPTVAAHPFAYSVDQVETILGEVDDDAPFLDNPAAIDLQRYYENLSKRTVTVQLHMSTLARYYREKRIPRGMRTRLRPNMLLEDGDFRRKFEVISDKYALEVIILHIECLQKQLKVTRKRLSDVDDILKNTLPSDEYNKFVDKQQAFLTKFRADLQEEKKHKWFRDTVDYETGRVYLWTEQPERNNNFKKTKKKDQVSATTNSNSSEVFLETSSGDNPRPDEEVAGEKEPPKEKRTRVTSKSGPSKMGKRRK